MPRLVDRNGTLFQENMYSNEWQEQKSMFLILFELCRKSHIWFVSIWKISFQLRKVTLCHKTNEV